MQQERKYRNNKERHQDKHQMKVLFMNIDRIKRRMQRISKMLQNLILMVNNIFQYLMQKKQTQVQSTVIKQKVQEIKLR
ncbi:unnamed protein product [Paramecium sonneborni]|uniref:Uncharacterized protein n=1 Tax=Paramecium sonneborni TaxID=65129 RepID=A0A8S1QAR6_9CILI|nr:unnamed protein product [Paramecium sonneborni]